MITDSVPPQAPEPQPEGAPSPQLRAARPGWLLPVAGAVVAVAVVIGVAVGVALNVGRTGGTASAAAGYVPANATMYLEMRLDLPGDQAANWRTFLGHFPKDAADTLLTDKLDTLLDEQLSKGGSAVRYSTDVKPWFDGSVAMAMVGYPSISGAMSGRTPPTPDILAFVGVRDQAAASAAIDKMKAESSTSPTSTTHGGATIWTMGSEGGTSFGSSVSWTVTADEIVIGTSADLVGTALDVHGGSKDDLASRSEFRDGLAQLPADRAATVAIDVKAITDQLKSDIASAAPSMAPIFESLGTNAATYMVGSARVEANRLVMDSSTALSAAPTAKNRTRGLAELTPSDALFFADVGDLGTNLGKAIDALKSVAEASGGKEQLDQAESILGADLASFVSWIGDAAIVVGAPGQQPYVGLIITPTDASQAKTRLAQLKGLLTLSAAGGGPAVTATEADHNGTTITTLTFGAEMPSDLAWAGSLQYAVTDDRVVIGSGSSFVTRVLDMKPSDSLAAQSRFSQAMTAIGGPDNLQTTWVDLAGAMQLVPASTGAEVTQWLTPLDYLAASVRLDGQREEARAVLVVK